MKHTGPLPPSSDGHYLDEERARKNAQTQKAYHHASLLAQQLGQQEPPPTGIRFASMPNLLYGYHFKAGIDYLPQTIPLVELADLVRHYRTVRSQYFERSGHFRYKNPVFVDTLNLFPPQGEFLVKLEIQGTKPEPLFLRIMAAGARQWQKRTNFDTFALVVNLNQGCPHGHPFGLTVSREGRLLRPAECINGGTNRLPCLGSSHLGVWRRHKFGLHVPHSDLQAILCDWTAREKRAGKKILDADVAQVMDDEFRQLIREHPEWDKLWQECLGRYARHVENSVQYQFRFALDLALRHITPALKKIHDGLVAARRGDAHKLNPWQRAYLTQKDNCWTIIPSLRIDVEFLLRHAREEEKKTMFLDLLATDTRTIDPNMVMQEIMGLPCAPDLKRALAMAKHVFQPKPGQIELRPSVREDLRRFCPIDLEEIDSTLNLVRMLICEPANLNREPGAGEKDER